MEVKRKRAIELLERDRPLLLGACPMCVPFSTLQNLTYAKLTKKQVLDIVKIKMKDLNARDESAAYRIIAGTARQMGVEVEAQ